MATDVGKFNTITGEIIDIHNPKPEMFNIVDIASALSKICRFGGQCSSFYSVAQHCVMVAGMVADDYALEGLMHDASEAYLGDVIKPLKIILGDAYEKIEQRFSDVIAEAFGLKKEAENSIKHYDRIALELEFDLLLLNRKEDWVHSAKSMGLPTEILTPEEAKSEFIKAYGKYRR